MHPEYAWPLVLGVAICYQPNIHVTLVAAEPSCSNSPPIVFVIPPAFVCCAFLAPGAPMSHCFPGVLVTQRSGGFIFSRTSISRVVKHVCVLVAR